MKIFIYLLLLIFFTSCTKKYETFHAIKKNQFVKDEPHNPVMPKLRAGRYVVQESCEGQVFWTRNAKKITDNNLIALIQYSCPGSEYLLNAKITEMWWTTIVYSRSCIKLESYCPAEKR